MKSKLTFLVLLFRGASLSISLDQEDKRPLSQRFSPLPSECSFQWALGEKVWAIKRAWNSKPHKILPGRLFLRLLPRDKRFTKSMISGNCNFSEKVLFYLDAVYISTIYGMIYIPMNGVLEMKATTFQLLEINMKFSLVMQNHPVNSFPPSK